MVGVHTFLKETPAQLVMVQKPYHQPTIALYWFRSPAIRLLSVFVLVVNSHTCVAPVLPSTHQYIYPFGRVVLGVEVRFDGELLMLPT